MIGCNDVEMLTFARDLKQVEWTVTLHHDEHGVAAAMDHVLEAKAAIPNAEDPSTHAAGGDGTAVVCGDRDSQHAERIQHSPRSS
jgi:hypothetical protein